MARTATWCLWWSNAWSEIAGSCGPRLIGGGHTALARANEYCKNHSEYYYCSMAVCSEASHVVSELAADQWGLVTSAQTKAEGVSSQQMARLADTGRLERLRHGVYRVAGTPSHPHDDLRAAWLALDPARTAAERMTGADVGVVSHRSAAIVHRLGDLDADYLDFIIQSRKQTRDPRIRFHRRYLDVKDQTLVDGLPVTTALATIGDLASAQLDGGHLAGVVRDAVMTQRVDLDDVTGILGPFAHHYGVPRGGGAELLQQLLYQAGIPENIRAVALLVAPQPRTTLPPRLPSRRSSDQTASTASNTGERVLGNGDS